VRPGDEWFKKTLQRGQRTVNILILATRLVIASTGAMLIVGHEAPFRISALACRIESRDHTLKEGNSRQVSGTSDASKTQSMLIRIPPAIGLRYSVLFEFKSSRPHHACGVNES